MEAAALPPRSPPPPWLLLGFQLPLPAPQPVEAGPVRTLPMPWIKKLIHFSPRGWGDGAARADRERGVRPVHPATQACCPQSRATGPVSSGSVPSPSSIFPGGGAAWVLGRAGVPERASTRRVSEATETLPQCILPHRAGFQGFFKAAGENLATVEKLTRSFHVVYMVLFLSFLPLKRKTQKNASDLCT